MTADSFAIDRAASRRRRIVARALAAVLVVVLTLVFVYSATVERQASCSAAHPENSGGTIGTDHGATPGFQSRFTAEPALSMPSCRLGPAIGDSSRRRDPDLVG